MMKKLKILVYLISFLFPFFAFGQTNFQNNLFKKSIEFSAYLLVAQPLGISKNYPTNENDLTPIYSLAFQGNLIRHANLNPKLSLQTGVVGGVSSMEFKLNLTEQFRSLDRDGFNNYFTEFEFPYVGVNIGINYILNSSQKNLFSVGVSSNGVFLIGSGFGYGIGSRSTSGVSKEILSANFEIEKKNRFLILPQIEIAYHRNINTHLSFKGALAGSFSNKNYLNATYIIHGDNQNLDGSLTKKLNHIGISVGLIYSLEKKVVVP